MGFNAFLVAASRPTVELGFWFLALFGLVVVSILGTRLILGSLTSLSACEAPTSFGSYQLSSGAVGVSPLFLFLPALLRQ